MNARTTGHRLFTDGVTRPVYEDERGQEVKQLTISIAKRAWWSRH
jgi:hypothetical protein